MPITGSQPALMPARLGLMRLGASRLGWYWPTQHVIIDGIPRDASNVRLEGFSIRDELDSIPNTATLSVDGFVPSHGHPITIYLGDPRAEDLVFAGYILQCTQRYDLLPHQLVYDLSCISHEWLLNRRKVTARYLSTSATAIATDLLATYAPEVSAAGVEAGLPALDEFTLTHEDMTDALDRLADRIGGHWLLDGDPPVLHLGPDLAPGGIPSAHPISEAAYHELRAITLTTDLSQVRTRVLIEAGGAQATVELVPGETIIPVVDPAWYDAAGGTVVSGPQHLTYTGVQAGGEGALVGTTATPTNAPTLALVLGTGIEAGVHGYAVTFYDAAGQTTPGPTATVTTGGVLAAPTSFGQAAAIPATPGGQLNDNKAYSYKYTYVVAGIGETTPSPATGNFSTSTTARQGSLTYYGAHPPSGATRQHYRTIGDGTTWLKMQGPEGGGFTGWSFVNENGYDNNTDGSLGGPPPTVNTVRYSRVALTNIPLGPPGTTGRKLYRTIAGGSQLQLLATLADNTTTTFADNYADGALGVNAPTANTSGLVSAAGTVLAGATTVPITASGPFAAGGGWAAVGTIAFRYAGTTATTLTGLPASGPGALTATINYGAELSALPALTGIPASGAGSVQFTIAKGDEVNLLVTRNDTAAQAALAALMGGDGIIEDFIQDRRLSQTEAESRGDARLAEVKDPEVRVQYTTRDTTTRSGRDVTITLTAPLISGTFTIQRVTMSDWDATQKVWPLRQVDASSRRFTFEQLLRLVKER